jgi:hypothetical protein
MQERAGQALVKLVLEPEWEAKFDPNSYGFRPGRSCHDAIEAIRSSITQQDKYVLDADIAKCFGAPGKARRFQRVQFPPQQGSSHPTGNRVLGAWR